MSSRPAAEKRINNSNKNSPSPRFVATGPVPAVVPEILETVAPLEIAEQSDEASLIKLMRGAIGVVVRGDTVLTSRIIEAGESLKVIGRTGVGYDNVDVAAATARRLPIVIAPGVGARAVAESTIGAMLVLAKKFVELDQKTRKGEWGSRHTTLIGDLCDMTLGIVGLGRIGRDVAMLAQPFGMKIVAYDPLVSPEVGRQQNIEFRELDELFRSVDVVSLHMPLIDSTKGIVTRKRLESMKSGSFLINYARGALFESLDCVNDVLNSGPLAGAAIDVYPTEPPDVSHPIFSNPKVLFTPHSVGLSQGAFRRIAALMSETMLAILRGEKPKNVANPEVYG